MRLDFEALRTIILYIEQNSSGKGLEKVLRDKNVSESDIKEHAILLSDGGYIESGAKPNGTAFVEKIYRLTPNGQEIAALIRDTERWDKANKKIKETVGSASFDILLELIRSDIRKELGIQ